MSWPLLLMRYYWQILSWIVVHLLYRRKRAVIFRLPNELLLRIFSLLSLTSQASFALSCKTFYEEFGQVLKHEAFRFPRVTEDGGGNVRFDKLANARSDLLLRLQDRRWAYCASCLKLHPVREFDYTQLAWPPEERHCIYPGIVVLCPCIQLTARGKLRLVDHLKKSTSHGNAQEEPVPWHECSITDHPWATVQIKISLGRTETGQLTVHTRYDIHLRTRNEPWREPPIRCCPHSDVLKYISTRSPLHPSHERHDCFYCQTSIEVGRARGGNKFSVRVARNLGGEKSPADQTWRHQRERMYNGLHW